MTVKLTASEVAEIFGVCVRTVQNWAKEGYLPSIRLHNSLRFDADALQAWLDGQATIAEKMDPGRRPQLRHGILTDDELLPADHAL